MATLTEAVSERDSLPFATSIAAARRQRRGRRIRRLPETDWQMEEGLSQGSQGTEPFAAIDEDTVPAKATPGWLRRVPSSTEDGAACTVGGLAILTLLMVLFYAIFK